MSKTSRDRTRDLIRRTGRRTVQATEAASVVAEQFQAIADAAIKTNPHLAIGIEAMRQVLAYLESIRADVEAVASHAAEGAELAADHAHEMAQIATVALNLADLDSMDEAGASRYSLPAGASEEMVRKVIANLEADVRGLAGKGGVTFELVGRKNVD